MDKLWNQKILACWSSILGVILYLIEPNAALEAVGVAVLLDLITRLGAESVKAGGFFIAWKTGRIESKKLFRGTGIKIAAYLTLAILAKQAAGMGAVVGVVPFMFSTIVYPFLFLVESISIGENLIDAGAVSITPLLLRFKREQAKMEREPTGTDQGDPRR